MAQSSSRRNFLKTAGLATLALPTTLVLTAQQSAPEIIKPKKLKKKATIGIVAPASFIRKPENAEKFFEEFTEKGYTIKRGKNIFSGHGYFAGTDAERLEDLHTFFADPDVDAIFALGGGWGSGRLLPQLDFSLIRNNPKILMGYSDITALHMGIHAQTGLVTFHGPNGLSDWNEFTTEQFEQLLVKNKRVAWEGSPLDEADTTKGRFTVVEGQTEGKLIGGNLTVISALVGTPYLPSFDGAILLLEDVREDVYRVDRYLTHLKLAGLLDKVRGIVFGSCSRCQPEELPEHAFSLKEMLTLNLKPLGKPCFFGMPFGHIKENFAFPIGVEAALDAGKGTLTLKEKALR